MCTFRSSHTSTVVNVRARSNDLGLFVISVALDNREHGMNERLVGWSVIHS